MNQSEQAANPSDETPEIWLKRLLTASEILQRSSNLPTVLSTLATSAGQNPTFSES